MTTILSDGQIVRPPPQVKTTPKTDGRRRTSDWLAAFLDHTSGLEVPHNYLLFTGLSTIAAVAQRKLYRDSQLGTLYPNMYVWLVGPPGTGKGVAMEAGLRLLRPLKEHGVHLTSDAPSVVGLMKDFADVALVQKDHQSLSAYVFELSTFFENAEKTMTGFLTAIYDGKADYTKRTRIGEKEHIPFPCFNMIGGTTPRWLGDNLDSNAVEGGFVARTLFLYSAQQRFGDPEPVMSPEYLKECDHLTHDLAHILTCHGQFEWDGGREGDAFQFYHTWFNDRSRLPAVADNRTWTYFVRKPAHILKISMALSLAEGNTKLLGINHLQRAKALLEQYVEPSMKKAFSAVGGNPYATDFERIGDQIEMSGGMTMEMLVNANFHNLDQLKLEMTLASLVAAGRITKNVKAIPFMYYPKSQSRG